MFDTLAATATSFPTPTPGTAGPLTLPEDTALPEDVESWPTDYRLARLLDIIDPLLLSDTDRVRYVQTAERMVAHHQAHALNGIGAVSDSYRVLELDDPEHVRDGTVFELRAALTWTRRYAETELDLATDLLVRLPQVLHALHAGRIDKRKAKVVVSDTAHLTVAHARQVADHILSDAESLTTGQLRARIRRACLDTDPDSCREQQKKAVTDRQFTSWTEPDGTMSLLITGIDPLRGQELLSRVNRIARRLRTSNEIRTMDQLRTDIAVDLLSGTDHPTLGTVHLTVDPTRLADPDLHSAVTLVGYGPILDDILERVFKSPTRRGETTNGTITPPSDGHAGRRPTAAQQRHVRANHPTCVGPGCRMPAVDCDLDHTVPYAESRWTRTSTLAPLCRKDHRIRHKTGWTYKINPDQSVTWHSPLGTTYTTNNRDP